MEYKKENYNLKGGIKNTSNQTNNNKNKIYGVLYEFEKTKIIIEYSY